MAIRSAFDLAKAIVGRTFKVTFVKGNLELGPDTTLCPGDSLLLQVSGNGFERNTEWGSDF